MLAFFLFLTEIQKNWQYHSRTLVKLKVLREDILTEPDFGVSIQQSLVIIVGDSAAILNFTDHVAYGRP